MSQVPTNRTGGCVTAADIEAIRALGEITEPNLDERNLKYLKESKLPVLIYGAKVFARTICDFLRERSDLQIAFISDLDITSITVCGTDLPVYPPGRVDGVFERYNMIPAHHEAFYRTDWSEFKNLAKVCTLISMYYTTKPSPEFVKQHAADFIETAALFSDRYSVDSYLACLRMQVTRDVSEIRNYVHLPNYFQPDIYTPDKTRVYLDIGAFDGGDATQYLEVYGGGCVVSFEPDPENYVKLCNRARELPNVCCVNKAVSDFVGRTTFETNESGSNMFSKSEDDGSVTVDVTTIDEFCKGLDKRVGLITADIEGAEMSMLRGGAETVKRDKPVLAIKAYHKYDDLITIPQYIHSLVPGYKFYFRNHTPQGDDCVVYAVWDHVGGRHMGIQTGDSNSDRIKNAHLSVFPRIGVGTFEIEGDIKTLVKAAVHVGYRLIDTAQVYKNEKEIGAALREIIADGEITRDDVLIQSKIQHAHSYKETIQVVESALLGTELEYFDNYMIHWPVQYKHEGVWREENFEIWRALEKLHFDGKLRYLSVSNFSERHMMSLLKNCVVKPLFNQIELHPDFQQCGLAESMREFGIGIQAWSPLGRELVRSPEIAMIAAKYGASPAQLLISWSVQSGCLPIVKSSSAERLQENMQILDIDKEDFIILNNMNTSTNHADLFGYNRREMY
jgi:FkbM family methyltransferase